MAVFIVVADHDAPALQAEIIGRYSEEHFIVEPNRQWLISANNITTEVAESLHARSGVHGRVLVAKIESSAGYHAKSLWEWITLKSAPQ